MLRPIEVEKIFSLKVQCISNSSNRIMEIVSRWLGSCHASHIFEKASVKARMKQDERRGTVLLLGDSGYLLCDYLMTRISNCMNRGEEWCNRSHILTRTVVELTFGIYKKRFWVQVSDAKNYSCHYGFAQYCNTTQTANLYKWKYLTG